MLLAACARKETISIGGSWEIVWISSPFPEAGGHHPFLWRHSKRTHVLVEGDTYTYKYIPDDCVLYVSLDSGHLGAACGDRQPLILDSNANHFRESSQQGYFDRDPLPINEHEQLPLVEILRRARSQPPLTDNWQMPLRRD